MRFTTLVCPKPAKNCRKSANHCSRQNLSVMLRDWAIGVVSRRPQSAMSKRFVCIVFASIFSVSLLPPVQGAAAVSGVDVVTITEAIYKPDRDEFKVRATSSGSPNTVLTVLDFGQMTFKSDKDRYELKIRPLSPLLPPSSVTVVSSLGGSATSPVAGAPTPTLPGKAGNPNPSDGTTNVSVNTILSWTAGLGSTSSVMYSGTDQGALVSQGSPAGTTFDPGPLALNTTYFWRIDEVNAQGTTAGVVWSFRTEAAPSPPGQATNPNPSQNTTGVSVNTSLSWTAGLGSGSHNVYFGTNPTLEFRGNQTGTTFNPGALLNNTAYYWRIDEVNPQGITTGPVWSFTAEPEGAGDVVTITEAIYKPDRDEFKVRATSSGSPNTVLTVLDFGQMTFKSDKDRYELKISPLSPLLPPSSVTVVSSLGGSATSPVAGAPVATNQPPVADAGADQTVTDTETVTLDGRGSSDPDGTIASFAWSEGGTSLGTADVISPSLSVGVHTITLTVTDAGGKTASDTVVVTVLAGTAAQVGEWADLQTLPWRPVHSILLPTGKVMMYSHDDPRIWDPVDGLLTTVPQFGYNPFCNGHVLLADGRVMFAGGQIANNVGLSVADYYDPFTNTFTSLPDMFDGRWYPSQVTLAEGDVVILSGNIDEGPVRNLIPEVWEVNTGTWRILSDASLFLPLYPAAFLAPNGKVFVATDSSRYLDTSGTGAWETVASRQGSGRDNYGSACMYDVGKVIYTGGGDAPVDTSEAIDLNAATPTWSFVASMPQARRHQNTTILPDGRVLVTGGSSSSGFNTEDGPKPAIVWNPDTNTWTTWATEAEYRGYHSEAVLLPDARVASIGGEGSPSLQVFSPPYLFNGPRPTITSAPSSVQLGETFFVETPDSADITQVTWVRPSAVTHTKNMNQRINKLSFTPVSGGLNVTAPSNANVCPLGDYMLFILNGTGVPSVAQFIQVT